MRDAFLAAAASFLVSTSALAGAAWQPVPGTEWQWEIDHPLNTSSAWDMGTGKTASDGRTAPATNPVIYDIDGFDNPAATVATLHKMGLKAVCYISVGTAENWRPDYSQFPKSAIGGADPGWSGENYIDFRNATVVSIMEARIAMCASKGFDAIETDNDETYQYGNTGFPLMKAEQEAYEMTLSGYAHGHGLAVWGKNFDDTGDSYAADMLTSSMPF